MLRRRIINEARIQRTIDPKIWASMSSMTSRLRANLAEDAKPKRTDPKDVLIQKYVAGLLTMKASCPETEADIDVIKAYKLFGHAVINAGGTMQEIQKLYVENGGSIDFEIDDTATPTQADYPSYEDADKQPVNNEPEELDQEPEDLDIEEVVPPFEPDNQAPESPEPIRDYPSYEEADKQQTQQFARQPETEITDEEPREDPVELYMRTVFRKVNRAEEGDFIGWDDDKGIVLTDTEGMSIATCIDSKREFTDGKARFLLPGSLTVAVGKPGCRGMYTDYYFKAVKDKYNKEDPRYTVIPGSKYYYSEGNNGKQYTDILKSIGNKAAAATAELAKQAITSLNINSDELQAISNYISDYAYLPTLPELVSAIDYLEPGLYWTSSVTDNGRSNIIYEINDAGDKFIKGNNGNDEAKVVAFIKF